MRRLIDYRVVCPSAEDYRRDNSVAGLTKALQAAVEKIIDAEVGPGEWELVGPPVVISVFPCQAMAQYGEPR